MSTTKQANHATIQGKSGWTEVAEVRTTDRTIVVSKVEDVERGHVIGAFAVKQSAAELYPGYTFRIEYTGKVTPEAKAQAAEYGARGAELVKRTGALAVQEPIEVGLYGDRTVPEKGSLKIKNAPSAPSTNAGQSALRLERTEQGADTSA